MTAGGWEGCSPLVGEGGPKGGCRAGAEVRGSIWKPRGPWGASWPFGVTGNAFPSPCWVRGCCLLTPDGSPALLIFIWELPGAVEEKLGARRSSAERNKGASTWGAMGSSLPSTGSRDTQGAVTAFLQSHKAVEVRLWYQVSPLGVHRITM